MSFLTIRYRPSGAFWRRSAIFLGKPRCCCHIRHVIEKSPHPYLLKIRSCTEDAGRFRWEILDSDGLLGTSWDSFSTGREARDSGQLEMQNLIEIWNKE
jgi:hypothetical protein